jgi:hypothetical protein
MTALIRRGIDQSLAIRFMRLARVKLIEKEVVGQFESTGPGMQARGEPAPFCSPLPRVARQQKLVRTGKLPSTYFL